MAGETARTQAICLRITPWSRTSHIVRWLTPAGVLSAVVKGAVRPKSQFLGQYDLNYLCDLVYYERARGELHALRECLPIERHDELRRNWRALALAEYFRARCEQFCPQGLDAVPWFKLLSTGLNSLSNGFDPSPVPFLARLLSFELAVLRLSGLNPAIEAEETGGFQLRGERRIPISPATASCLQHPQKEKNLKILVDAARVIGIYYVFHLDSTPETRRQILEVISKPVTKGTEVK